MKKLKLKLDDKQMLSKDQMKKVTGGYSNQGYLCTCSDGSYTVYVCDIGQTCAENAFSGCGSTYVYCEQLWCIGEYCG